MSAPTGYWTEFSLATPRDQAACRSWVGALVRDEDEVLIAQGWERNDGEMPKIRLLVKRSDGKLREVTRRQLSRSWKLTATRVSGDLMKAAKDRGLVQ